MDSSVTAPGTPVSGMALFYQKPEPLSFEVHGKLGLRRIDRPFAFSAQGQAVPLTVSEFLGASLSYPVIFAGERYTPVGVMGIEANVNMYLQPNGYFEPGVYVPGYIRRYPFTIASDAQRQQFVICIDRQAEMVGDLPDLPFFEADGQASEYTKGCIKFCNDYEQELRRTESFVQLLRDLDLFEIKKALYTPANPDGTPGPPQEIAEYYAVSEDKLKALPDPTLRELMDNGALRQIYTHLNSLGGWDRLIAITLAKQAANTGPTFR
jgi:hypothetical protein